MQAVLELIAARIDDGQIRFTVARRACASGMDPDDIAAEGLDELFPQLPQTRVVLHSTSWRYADGVLTLTYLGYSEDLPLPELPLTLPPHAEASGQDANSVVAHAIRHLAFLAVEEPAKYAGALDPDTIGFLAGIAPDVAGRLQRRRAA